MISNNKSIVFFYFYVKLYVRFRIFVWDKVCQIKYELVVVEDNCFLKGNLGNLVEER